MICFVGPVCLSLTVPTDQNVDPTDPLRKALVSQGKQLRLQEEQMTWLRQEVAESNKRQEAADTQLASQLSQLVDHIQQFNITPSLQDVAVALATAPAQLDTSCVSGSPEKIPLRLSGPERFPGDSGDCRPLLTQCDLHFEFQSSARQQDSLYDFIFVQPG